jgi:DNA-binding NtrC family response regulator
MPERPAPGKTPPRGRVLVVEDEEYVRSSLGEVLRARGFDVDLAACVAEALAALERSPIDLVLTDLKMPRADGLTLVIRVRDLYPGLPIVVLTGQGTIPSAVACIKAGANDYLLKPVDPDTLEAALDRALETRALRREVDYLRRGQEDDPEDDSLPVGTSAAWNEVMRRAHAAAPNDATVLLLGESGTGKELVARLIHRLSRRAQGPYVRVNCAAIPLEMWESEFFGHRRGAFTGATADHDGRFRLAHRGTLFMDEIGSMPPAAQAKILRVLQDGEFDRLGDTQPTRVDVRVIAATNSDLPADAAAGRFRQDLFYRLNVIRLDLPPLRDRPEDIPLLAKRSVRQIAARLGRPAPEIGLEEMADFLAYPWPGNVRELQNVIERALILNPGPSLGPLDLPAPDAASSAERSPTGSHSAGSPLAGTPPPGRPSAGDLNLRSALGDREKELVEEALRRSGGVRKEAARLLGIDQRNLGYYLRKHAIDPDKDS